MVIVELLMVVGLVCVVIAVAGIAYRLGKSSKGNKND